MIANNTDYCGKILHFAAGRQCSLHYHKLKHETFFLSRGYMRIYYHDDLKQLQRALGGKLPHDVMEHFEMRPGQVFDVPIGRIHQMVALEDSDLIEFSTTHHDSDSYRLIKGD